MFRPIKIDKNYALLQEVAVVFYTLKGPGYKLEVYQDKINLKRRWWKLIGKEPRIQEWKLDELSEFIVNQDVSRFWGELKWKSFDGIEGRFYCSTNPQMLQKIEKYLNKRISHNKSEPQKHLKGKHALQENMAFV